MCDVGCGAAARVPKTSYLREALDHGVGGTVLLRLLIDSSGRVQRAEVLRDPGYGLGVAAVRMAIENFRFKPGEVAGRPVACWWTFSVSFEPTPSNVTTRPVSSARSP
jgi:TonB family protein